MPYRLYGTYGIDCTLKPVDEDKLAGSLRKYEQMKLIIGTKNGLIMGAWRLFCRDCSPRIRAGCWYLKMKKIIPVKTVDIAFIYSAAGIVKVSTKNNQSYLLTEVLDELEPMMDPISSSGQTGSFLLIVMDGDGGTLF